MWAFTNDLTRIATHALRRILVTVKMQHNAMDITRDIEISMKIPALLQAWWNIITIPADKINILQSTLTIGIVKSLNKF